MNLYVFIALGNLSWMAFIPLATGQEASRYYVTVQPKYNFEEKTNFSAQEIEAAKLAVECGPAELDREGHWGSVSEGFQLSIRFARTEFTNREPVMAELLLRNVSDRPQWYPVSSDGSENSVRLMKGQDRIPSRYEPKDNSFVERLKAARPGSEAFWVLSPGTQRKLKLDLTK